MGDIVETVAELTSGHPWLTIALVLFVVVGWLIVNSDVD